jgi:hypothetical protein
MRFGGHETFYVREGWLSKGLKMVRESPERFDDPFVADHLGVGRNMAKSIEHWLVATGLVLRRDVKDGRGAGTLRLTALGNTVANRDPYLTHVSTWWFLHINLVCNADHAATWGWFFNDYPSTRFERGILVTSLDRAERLKSRKPASVKTLERDVSCFLGSYAVDVPYRRKDPEEEIDCPFQELRLVKHYRATGYFELNRRRKPVEPEVVLYALNSFEANGTGNVVDIRLQELAHTRNGPLQTLSLTAETLYEHLMDLEALGEPSGVTIAGLAGDRQIRFPRQTPAELAERYFDRVREVAYA